MTHTYKCAGKGGGGYDASAHAFAFQLDDAETHQFANAQPVDADLEAVASCRRGAIANRSADTHADSLALVDPAEVSERLCNRSVLCNLACVQP